ncbi:MAG: hypothetical protein NC548_09370 [Lachnospiraceae bacterium]|nr:hypothetical protein [Lachnospiraceae bacterium]
MQRRDWNRDSLGMEAQCAKGWHMKESRVLKCRERNKLPQAATGIGGQIWRKLL